MSAKLNILLIDDNSTVLLITQALLKKENYIKETDTFDTLKSIEELTDKELLDISSKYDVIICDHNLEERITGLDFLITLSKYKFVGLKILLTSDESYDLHARVERENINYITKNIEEGENSTNALLGNLITEYRKQIV